MRTRVVVKEKWVMPDWMEPYREMFQNTGGNSIEDLMNDNDPYVGQTNVIRAALIVSVESQITLLVRMHSAGLLKTLKNKSPFVYRSERGAWIQPPATSQQKD